MRTHAILAFACALSCACGARTAWDDGSSIGGGYELPPDGGPAAAAAAAPFVGTWICDDTYTVTSDSPGAQSITDILTFVENANGTLTMTGRIAGSTLFDGGGSPCAVYTFVVSGSMATAISGTLSRASCDGDDGGIVYTFRSGYFAVSGDTAQFELNTTVTGSAVDPSDDSDRGACTKDDAGAP